MTVVSNDPSLLPTINTNRNFSYVAVATAIVLVYDWALTFREEFELIWRKRWSHMTILYLAVRCLGIAFIVTTLLFNIQSVSVTDTGCTIIYRMISWISIIVNTLVGVIVVIRLHAMYQRSRKILFFLVAMFLATVVLNGVVFGMATVHIAGEEFILFGTHQCFFVGDGPGEMLIAATWIFGLVWEGLALCLAVWIVIKHLRELRRTSTAWTISGTFAVLISTHVLYFAAFVAVACFSVAGTLSSILTSNSMGALIYWGFLQIVTFAQMFVLGPRLILSVREHNAKAVAESDEGTAMTTIAFQERTQRSTGDGV